MLANAAMIFAVGGVSGQVQFVLNAPVSAVEGKQAVLVGLFDRKAGNAADDFLGSFGSFGAGTTHHEDLSGEGEVDSAGGDGRGNDTAGVDASAGFICGAMGRGKKCAPRGAVRFVCVGFSGYL